jgi:hypothetical protein
MPRNTRKLPRNKVTFQGLQDWHNSVFERLGWMVLADAKGYKSKTAQYKREIQHLCDSIDQGMSNFMEADRIRDLKILRDNVRVLLAHVKKDF